MSAWMSRRIDVGEMIGLRSFHSGTKNARARPGGIFLLLVYSVLICCTVPAPGQRQVSKSSAGIQKANSLLQQGRLQEAKIEVQAELERDPASVEGYNLLGIIASDERDFAGARAAFESAVKLQPNGAEAHINLGNVYVAEKNLDQAEQQFRTALRLAPGNRDGNYNLGVLLLAKGSPIEAIAHLEQVRPANLATKLNLIRAYFQSKRTAEALRMAAQLSTQNKDDVQVHFTLGVLLAGEKQYKPAQLELEQADALKPGTFEILFNLGQAFLRNRDYSKAELTLARALKLKPESSDTLYLLAQVYADESRPLDALDLLVRAHRIAPDNTDITFLMAQVSMSQNYFEDAIPLLESALAVAPRRPDLLAALGESYFKSGKIDKAIEVFEKLVEVEPTARSYAFLGLSYRQLGRFDEAKQYFDHGLKLDPHDSSCLFNLGFIAERQGNADAADVMFQQLLRYHPNYSDALLELANLRIADKRLPEAADLLRRFVLVSRDPETGYYKLAMVERNLHQTVAADRDLKVFQTLSKDAPSGAYPYEHLFDYLDNRSQLAPGARAQLDIAELSDEIKKHPDQPESLYLLAEAYLKSGKVAEARSTIADLDKMSAGDYRTQAGVGVLLARYHLYDDSIQHFQAALSANPDSDGVKYDLANAYFRDRKYSAALDIAGQVSEAARKDDAYLSLLGDIYAHVGQNERAAEIFREVIGRNPDNDQGYLALALLQLRENDIPGAKQTLSKGQARMPASGKILWGLGLASVLEGNTAVAAGQFERAVEMLPEWPGSYSTLGVFYFETGQIAKAKEVLDRFKNSNAAGGLDVNRIEQVLEQTPAVASASNEPLTMANRAQLLQLALTLADRTL